MAALTRRLVQALALANFSNALHQGPARRLTSASVLSFLQKPLPLRAVARCPPPLSCVVRRASSSATPEEILLQQRSKKRTRAASNAVNTGGSRARAAIKHRVISLFEKARKAACNGDLEAARTLFGECLSLDATDAHSWLALAQLEADAGNESHARSLFEAACDECGPSVRLLQARGVFEARSGHTEAARTCFKCCMALQPRNAHVAHAWGHMEEGLGNLDAARRVFSESLRVFVNDSGDPAMTIGRPQAIAPQVCLVERAR